MYWRRGEVRQLWMAHHQQLVSAVAGIIRKGVDEGQVRRDVAPEVLAGFLLGMMRARAHMPTETADPSQGLGVNEARSVELVVDLFIHGVSQQGALVAQEGTR